MAIRPLVIVSGYALPEPSEYSANTATLVDSARNAKGYMIGSVLRDDVAKVEISWRYLTAQQWSDILKLFRESSNGRFVNTVEFYAQDVAGWVTKELYVSDRSSGMWRRNHLTGDVMGWVGCKLSLIEV